jgi:hypothetical protein
MRMTNRDRLLELALKGLEAERAEIGAQIKEVQQELQSLQQPPPATRTVRVTPLAIGGRPNGHAAEPPVKPKRKKMSARARKNISLGMQRRYAELKKAREASQQPKPRKKMSAATRRKLSLAMKRRHKEAHKRGEIIGPQPKSARSKENHYAEL